MTRIDVAVVGGGIVGLAAARELALRGFGVQVLERDRAGSHASSAAAGILTTRGARHSTSPGREFYLRSLLDHPRWVARLAEESAHPLRVEEGDDWCLFPAGSGADRFRDRLVDEADPSSWSEEESLPAPMGPTAPGLRVFRIRTEHWTDPLHLLPALREATLRQGVALEESCGRVQLSRDGEGWSLRTNRRTLLAKTVVVAAGPWTSSILEPLGWSATQVPVRGQLALVPALHPLGAMVHLEDIFYAVPREGWTLVGATMEHGILDEEVTAGGLHALQDRLRTVFPALDLSRAGRTWSGIRPRTRDRIPHVGWLEPGLLVAAGHFRSGISTAPRTAALVADLVSGTETFPDARDLDPLRPGAWRRN